MQKIKKRISIKRIMLAVFLLLSLMISGGCANVEVTFKRDKTAVATIIFSDETILDGKPIDMQSLTDYMNRWQKGVHDVSADKNRVSISNLSEIDGGYSATVKLKDLTLTKGEGEYVFKDRASFFSDFNNKSSLLLMERGKTNSLRKWDSTIITPDSSGASVLAFASRSAEGGEIAAEELEMRTQEREFIFMFENYFAGVVEKITLKFPGIIKFYGGQGVELVGKDTLEIKPVALTASVTRAVNGEYVTQTENVSGMLGFVLFEMHKSYLWVIVGSIAAAGIGIVIFIGIKRKWFKKMHASKPAVFFRQNFDLYLLMLPGAVLLFIFSYLPMSGIILAFKNYTIDGGIFGSEWVGFNHFENLFFDPGSKFWEMFRNTVVIAALKMLVCFPASIIIALMFNEVRNKSFRKFVEIISYIPYFISWVVISGICYNFFSADNGLFNNIRELFGLEPIVWYSTPRPWWTILTLTSLWKGAGWGAIIYLAAIANVNTELYDAAYIDGASILKRIWHVTIPGIMPIIIMQLILSTGNLIRDDFEQIMTMTNNQQELQCVTNVFSSVSYQQLIGGAGGYGPATAIGLFQSVVALIFILVSNYIAKKTDNMTLW